jgi:hypothetical protein
MRDRDGPRVIGEGPDHETIVRYLLGTLPEDEQARLEEEYFRDDRAFERVLAVEDELLHDYAQGGLDADERRRLEERLLRTPEGQARLSRARALLAELPADTARARSGPRARPVPTAWLVAAAVLLAVVAGWLAFGRDRGRVDQAQDAFPLSTAPGVGSTPSPSSGAVVPSTGGAPTARVVALALAPGLTRADAPPQRVTIPSGASTLRLELGLPEESPRPSYRAVLSSAEGAEVWSGAATRAGPTRLGVEIPADRVPEGDYELVLTGAGKGGLEELASYTFGVLRE